MKNLLTQLILFSVLSFSIVFSAMVIPDEISGVGSSLPESQETMLKLNTEKRINCVNKFFIVLIIDL
jgi:hypothetical protein